MDWKDLGAKIASYAPTLGATLGSVVPGVGTAVGGAVGLGIKALAGMLGITSANPTPDELNAALGPIDPETALKLKVADQTFTLEMRKIELDELRTQLADVQNARAREIAMKGSNTTFYSIGWIITLSFFGAIVMIIFKPIAIGGEMRDVLNMMLGYLASNFTCVVSYFYGSSKGSADKSAAMDKTATALASKVNGGK